MRDKTLVVVGAGPKGLAIYLKAKALRSFRKKPPRIVVIDNQGVAANWNGSRGFTDGNEELATPPELDLGYPYSSTDPRLNDTMRRFSWHSYLQGKRRYTEWIDKGSPPPTHLTWAKYLWWTVKGDKEWNENYLAGRVVDARWAKGHWELEYRSSGDGELKSIKAHGIVITGPGASRHIAISEPHEALSKAMCTGQTFWNHAHLARFAKLRDGKVVVIGAGDTAATIVVKLANLLSEKVRLAWLTLSGSLYTRSESFAVRRYYSDPDSWVRLPVDARERLIASAHEGVVSLRTLARVDGLHRAIDFEVGEVMGTKWNSEKGRVVLSLEGRAEPLECERVVVAIGFDDLSCRDVLPEGFFPRHAAHVSHKIGRDLMYDETGIHLPMLAALKQGPGFPTLGCLGILSDRILEAYCAL